MGDLRIGAEILKEALDRELTKEEREERAKREEKAIKASEVANVGISSRRAVFRTDHTTARGVSRAYIDQASLPRRPQVPPPAGAQGEGGARGAVRCCRPTGCSAPDAADTVNPAHDARLRPYSERQNRAGRRRCRRR